MMLTMKGNYNTKSARREKAKAISEPVDKNINITLDLSKQFKVVKLVGELGLMLTGLADFRKYEGL